MASNLNLDRQFYFVISNHRDGPYVPEVDLDRMTRAQMSEDLRHGQYSDVLHVIQFNPVEHTCEEVTDEFKQDIADGRPQEFR